uniref:Uncharacterized protein n=1 Tax=Rhipicephalus zambeziensis TaxID=60191 RepID=A0A224YKU7_9ACAR
MHLPICTPFICYAPVERITLSALQAACYVTAREYTSVVRLSGRSHGYKNARYKLSSRPNALKFRQLVREQLRINPHNTDYERKLFVILAPLTPTHLP